MNDFSSTSKSTGEGPRRRPYRPGQIDWRAEAAKKRSLPAPADDPTIVRPGDVPPVEPAAPDTGPADAPKRWHAEGTAARVQDLERTAYEILKFLTERGYQWHQTASPPPIPFLIFDTLPERALALLVGMEGAGKTFLLIHLAICISAGLPFAGVAPARRGGVVVFHGEGAEGIVMRIHVAAKTAGIREELPIVHRSVTGSMDEYDTWTAIREEIPAIQEQMREQFGVELEMIAVDTAMTCYAIEDFNAAGPVAKALNHMKLIRDTYKCVSLLVHHLGKDLDRGPLGSVAFKAMPDTIFAARCTKDSENIKRRDRKLVIEKQKDGSERAVGGFDLRFHRVGVDPETERPYGSMYLEFQQPGEDELPDRAKLALDVLRKVINQSGRKLGNLVHRAVHQDVWRDAYSGALVHEGCTNPETQRNAFGRAKKKLKDLGFIGISKSEVWLTDEQER